MKDDHLCTLLLTFNDLDDPLKETTTAHAFTSIDPTHYPQRRRVVHSTHNEKVKSAMNGEMHTVRTSRLSRAAHGNGDTNLGSDFVENRVYRIKSVTPNATAPTSPLLSHTCTTSSSAAGDDSGPPSPCGRVDVQEVTLTYMREAGAAPLSGHSHTTAATARPGGGTLDFSQRRRRQAEDAHSPYRVRDDNSVRYDYDQFVQISDTVDASSLISSPRSKPYAMPLRIDTVHAKRTRAASGGGDREGFQRRGIRFKDDDDIDADRSVSHKRANEASMSHWQSAQQSRRKEQPQRDLPHQQQTKQQQSAKQSAAGGGRVIGTKTSRTIYERTTSEVTMSKSTTRTVQRPAHAPPSQPHRPPPYSASADAARQAVFDAAASRARRHATAATATSGLPRYHDNDIRVHTRYDDDYVYRGSDAERIQRPAEKSPRYTTTTFPTMPQKSAGFEPSSQLWRYEYEEEEEEERYYERVTKSGASGGSPTAKAPRRGMTPFGSTKNFSDAAAKWRDDFDRRPQDAAQTQHAGHYSSGDNSELMSPPAYPAATAETAPAGQASTPMRLIDYDTYRHEVEQLQREAAGAAATAALTDEGPVPLTPAVVLSPVPAGSGSVGVGDEHRLQFLSQSDLDRQHLVSSVTSPPASRQEGSISTERDPYAEAFGRRVDAIQTSPRFRPLVQEAPTLSECQTRSQPDGTKLTSARLVLQATGATESGTQKAPPPTARSDQRMARTASSLSGATKSSDDYDRERQKQKPPGRTAPLPSPPRSRSAGASREFLESERQEFEDRYYQPDSYRVASYTEEYEFRHRLERSEERRQHQEQQRRPYYVERATHQNVDICVENVSPPTSRRGAVPASAAATDTTAFLESAGATRVTAATTFGVTPAPATRAVTTRDTATMPHQKSYVTTSEASTQRDAAIGVDVGTKAAATTPGHEIGVQVERDDASGTGRELLETLRRELQYEELIDLEVRRRQRVVQDPPTAPVGAAGSSSTEPLAPLREEEAQRSAGGDELVETFEPVITGEEIIGVTSETNENPPMTPHLNSEVLSPFSALSDTTAGTIGETQSALTRTTDEPMGRILGTDVLSEPETLLQDELEVEYESRTLTPSSDRHKPPSSQPPPSQYAAATALPPSAGALHHITQSTHESSREYYPPSVPSDYDRSHPTVHTERYQTRGIVTEAHHQPLPQQHQQHYTTHATTKSRPMAQPRAESVSSTRNVTTFSPIAGDGDGRSTSAAAMYPTIEPRHPRMRSSSPLRSVNYVSYQPSKMEYSSGISQRPHFVGHHRRAMSPTPLSHRTIKTIQSETSSVSSGLFSPYGGSTAASTIRDAREREKKEMSDLNDRLASYIEKVRFLEAQNRKLAADLEFLHNRWGKDTSNIRDMYEVDIQQAQKLIDDTNRQREDMKETIRKLEEEIANLRHKFEDAERSRYLDKEQIDELLMKLSALEGEIALLKRRIAILEDEVACTKRENHRLLNDLQHARNDLDQQTLNRIDYQNQVQTLIEEIDFLRRAHDSEIHDLQAMASRDTTSENREYFRNELSSAIREIRSEYDKVCNVQRVDMESWYKLKVQEIQTQSNRQSMEQSYAKEEIRRLRVQLGDLRGKLADLEGRNALLEKQAEELNYQLEDDQRSYESALNDRDSQIRKIRDECQMLMVELQMLLDTKQTLDAEIAIYRKMLDGEEDRAGLRQLLEQVTRTHHFKQADETETMRVLRGETSSRNSYQRSAKGNIAIREVAPDASFIIIENTHRSRAENIGEWRLRRRIDNGKRELHFTFPPDFVLGPARTVKIWARNQGPYNPPDELVFDAEDTFGIGNNVQNTLYNAQGEERASLNQRSNYTASAH